MIFFHSLIIFLVIWIVLWVVILFKSFNAHNRAVKRFMHAWDTSDYRLDDNHYSFKFNSDLIRMYFPKQYAIEYVDIHLDGRPASAISRKNEDPKPANKYVTNMIKEYTAQIALMYSLGNIDE